MSSKNLAVCWKLLKPLLLAIRHDKCYNKASDNAKDVTMDNQQATRVELGWLAGIIDGEGYLGISISKDLRWKKTYQQATAMMHICNTDEEIILRATRILDKLGIRGYVRIHQAYRPNSKIAYKVQIKKYSTMKKLLDCICPYLTGSKAERGKLILEFCNSRIATLIRGKAHPFSERELEIIELCLPLQRRGASETIRKAQIEKSEIAKIQRQRLQLKPVMI